MSKKSFAKKITTSVAGIDPKLCNSLVEEHPDRKIPILRVYGKVSKYEVGTNTINSQPYQKFTGEFECVNIITKEKTRSQNLILPDVCSMFVMNGFEGAKRVDPAASFAFGLDVAIEKNPSNKGGNQYRFCVLPLTDTDTKDGLDLLGESLGELPNLLAGPNEPATDTGSKKSSKK